MRLCDTNLWNNILSEIFHTDIVLISDYKTENKNIKKNLDKYRAEIEKLREKIKREIFML